MVRTVHPYDITVSIRVDNEPCKEYDFRGTKYHLSRYVACETGKNFDIHIAIGPKTKVIDDGIACTCTIDGKVVAKRVFFKQDILRVRGRSQVVTGKSSDCAIQRFRFEDVLGDEKLRVKDEDRYKYAEQGVIKVEFYSFAAEKLLAPSSKTADSATSSQKPTKAVPKKIVVEKDITHTVGYDAPVPCEPGESWNTTRRKTKLASASFHYRSESWVQNKFPNKPGMSLATRAPESLTIGEIVELQHLVGAGRKRKRASEMKARRDIEPYIKQEGERLPKSQRLVPPGVELHIDLDAKGSVERIYEEPIEWGEPDIVID